MNPFIEQTLAMTPEELEKLSKDDKEFTFLHNIALYSRDPKVIRDQIMAVLLAGRDTTASTLSWTLYELANYPDIWQRLRTTVLDKVGPTGTPTYEDIKSMTYLSHALSETLRLYPAVPYNIRFARTFTFIVIKKKSLLTDYSRELYTARPDRPTGYHLSQGRSYYLQHVSHAA